MESDWVVGLAVVLCVLFAGGVQILMARRYKRRTGKDHGGALFWKRVLGRSARR